MYGTSGSSTFRKPYQGTVRIVAHGYAGRRIGGVPSPVGGSGRRQSGWSSTELLPQVPHARFALQLRIQDPTSAWRSDMAPHAGFDTDQIKEKARKDLLYLLEGVSGILVPRPLHLTRARH